MKSIISKMLTLVALAAILLSFSSGFGGEGFEISVNGKVMLRAYGNDMNSINDLKLNAASPHDKVTIRYYHCGRIGKNRLVIIKDTENNVEKILRYRDPKAPVSDMSCSVQDFLNVKEKTNSSVFKLYYSSSELPGGRQLASVTIESSNKVQP